MPAVVYHPAYAKYAFGKGHPFDPARIEMTVDLLHALGHNVRIDEPQPATREDILTVQEEYYVRRVEALSDGQAVFDCEEYGLDTPDNPAFPGMDEAAQGAFCSWAAACTTHAAILPPAFASTTILRSQSTI
jgi:acetoin utilization protein AcuC